jgi:hypothetical protein
MNEDDYWYGAPKSGEPEFEINELAQSLGIFGKTFAEAMRRSVDNVFLGMSIGYLNRRIESLEAMRNSFEGRIQYESQMLKVFELNDLITAYAIVVDDLETVRETNE